MTSNQKDDSAGASHSAAVGNPLVDMRLETEYKERPSALAPDYPKLKYKLRKRKKAMTYQQTAETIRSMFLQQSELWKRRALQMEKLAALQDQQVVAKSMLSFAFQTPQEFAVVQSSEDDSDENEENEEGVAEGQTIRKLNKRLDAVQNWRFERDEASDGENSNDDEGTQQGHEKRARKK